VAHVRYAPRPPRNAAKQDYLLAILPRINALRREKCDENYGIIMQMIWHNRKITLVFVSEYKKHMWGQTPPAVRRE